MENRHIKPAVNAVVAAVAALILPTALALWIIFFGAPFENPYGKADYTPARSAVLLLTLSPFFLAILTGYFFCITSALQEFGKLSFWALLGAGALCSTAVGWFFLFQGLEIGGIRDGIASFAIFFGGSFACLISGSVAWWLFHMKDPI